MEIAFNNRSMSTLPEPIRASLERPDPSLANGERLATRGVAALLGAVMVLVLGSVVRHSTADSRVTRFLNAFHTGGFGIFTTDVYASLEPMFAVLVACAFAVGVWWLRRNFWAGLAFGLTVAIVWLPVVLLKLVFDRPRPSAALLLHPMTIAPNDWSFPSGHTAFITALAVSLFFVCARGRWRPVVGLFGVGAVVIVAGSVLVDGVHYPSDVLASLLWASTMTPLAWVFVARGVDRLANKAASIVGQSATNAITSGFQDDIRPLERSR